MAVGNYEPDWGSWLLMPDLPIEAAVALSLNVDPDKLLVWTMRAPVTDRAEFQRRVSWAERWPLHGPNDIRFGYEGGTRTIYLRDFVEMASAARWKLPAPLLRLATAAAGENANAASEVPKDGGQCASAPNAYAVSAVSKREQRAQKKNRMYEMWEQLAIEYGLKESRMQRRPRLISNKIARDPRAKDLCSGKPPAAASVIRRLNARCPGWAEKSWAEKHRKDFLPSQLAE